MLELAGDLLVGVDQKAEWRSSEEEVRGPAS